MQQLTILKTRRKPEDWEQVGMALSGEHLGHLCSAVWRIKELPGLFLARSKMVDTSRSTSFWQVNFYATIYGTDRLPLSERIAGRLQGQKFETRRDAAIATQAALLIEDC